MTPKPRFITKPGCTCVCKDCGAPLVLTCPKGHEPAEYILGTEEYQRLPGETAAAPKGKERKIRVIPSPTGLCKDCGEVFDREKKPGRPATRCRRCRGAESSLNQDSRAIQ